MTKVKMTSNTQLHPLFAAFSNSVANAQSSSSSPSSGVGGGSSGGGLSSSALAAAAAAAAAAGSHLSVTITPANGNGGSSSGNNNNGNGSSSSNGSSGNILLNNGTSISPSNLLAAATNSLSNSSSLLKIDPPSSAASDTQGDSPCPSPSLQGVVAGQMPPVTSAQLRQLASNLQSAVAAANNNQGANVLAAAAAASKLMEMNSNPIDDLVMSEVTQRLFKMNQELWQQNVANAAAAGQQQANEIKLAEKLVNELAVQQSTRNAFHLNERTLQECWNTLQRVSCMIFMHKSAMQLQQQQQQAAAAAQQQVSGGGGGGPGSHIGSQHHGQLIRAGSSSGSESGALSKPHQCQQCLKSFSSNHQLVQHIRVHTGEKPYKCSYCDRRFKQLSHVQQHTRLHTGERPYKCHVSECGRAFIQLSNLQQHLRNHDAQLERSKNRPFHCNICGKGFATESSLRTHTAKVCKDQHQAMIGGPNAVSCPLCHKLFLGGEALMEHMKHTHKDPNASGVATKRRTANHPCPVCGKHYVNEGSLRKHLACHPETAQLTSTLRMWPCSVCQAVFTHENGLLTHMEQMRMDPKHQFAAQYVLSRAAAERRERENILAAAAVAAMAQAGSHPFGGGQGQSLTPSSLGSLLPMPASPSGSESSGRLSSPLDTNSGVSHSSVLQHTRMSMSSPVSGPLDARVHGNNNSNNTNTSASCRNPQNGGLSKFVDDVVDDEDLMSSNTPSLNSSFPPADNSNSIRGDHSHHSHHQQQQSQQQSQHQSHHHSSHHHHPHHLLNENGSAASASAVSMLQSPKIQDAMKIAAMMGSQSHLGAHGTGGHGGHGQADIRSLIHHHAAQAGHDMMASQESMRLQAEALLRSQAAEAIRLAVDSSGRNNSSNSSNSPTGGPTTNGKEYSNNNHNNNGDHLGSGLSLSQGGSGLSHSGHHNEFRNSALEIRMSSSGNSSNSPSMTNGGGSGSLHQQSNHGNPLNNLHNSHHSSATAAALNHHQQHLDSILSQQSDLSQALLRQLDARSLGFPLQAHNS